MSPQPVQPVTVTGFGTKAETVAKKTIYGQHMLGITVTLDAPPIGQKTGLILIVATTDGAGGSLKMETWQTDEWNTVWDEINIEANAPLILALPCFVPTQTVGDGIQNTVRITQSGACGEKLTLMVIYYDEANV